ncbi:MAG TPA: cysteine--tRNA ligase, partial [Chloroflexota bacterium]
MQARPSIYLTNTLTRNVEEFTPLVPGEVSMYTCGPTVYSYAHIGNFRAFLMADTLRRVFEYNGYKVKQVRNITDVGHLTNDTLSTGADKIEEMARREQVTPWDIARHFTDAFLEDTKRLDMEEPACMPRATQYIPQMIGLIERLIEREYAYEARGNVYFDVTRFPRYGA